MSKMKGLLIAVVCLFFTACSGERAISLLEAEGYENIKITNSGRLRCTDNDDMDRTSFTADKYGEEVEGRVCIPYLFRYYVTKIRRGEVVYDDDEEMPDELDKELVEDISED